LILEDTPDGPHGHRGCVSKKMLNYLIEEKGEKS
jgi:hypothetical protein